MFEQKFLLIHNLRTIFAKDTVKSPWQYSAHVRSPETNEHFGGNTSLYIRFSCFFVFVNTQWQGHLICAGSRKANVSSESWRDYYFLRTDLRAAAFQRRVWLLLLRDMKVQVITGPHHRIKMFCLLLNNTLFWSVWLRLHSINKVVIATAPFAAYFDNKSVCASMFFLSWFIRVVSVVFSSRVAIVRCVLLRNFIFLRIVKNNPEN